MNSWKKKIMDIKKRKKSWDWVGFYDRGTRKGRTDKTRTY